VLYEAKGIDEHNLYVCIGTPVTNEEFFNEVIKKHFADFFLVVLDDYGILEKYAPSREAYELMRAECRRVIEEFERKHKQYLNFYA